LWENFNPHCQPPWDDPDDDTFVAPIRSAYRNPGVVFGRAADPAPEPGAGFNSAGQFDSAFPDAPESAAGVARTLSRGL
jgi:hypothetical protein